MPPPPKAHNKSKTGHLILSDSGRLQAQGNSMLTALGWVKKRRVSGWVKGRILMLLPKPPAIWAFQTNDSNPLVFHWKELRPESEGCTP